jgi:hypothetical protein
VFQASAISCLTETIVVIRGRAAAPQAFLFPRSPDGPTGTARFLLAQLSRNISERREAADGYGGDENGDGINRNSHNRRRLAEHRTL